MKDKILKSGNKKDIKKINDVADKFSNITRDEYVKISSKISSLEYKYGYSANDWMKIYKKSPTLSLFRDGRVMMDSEKFNQNLLAELYDFNISDVKEYKTPIYYVLGRFDEWTTSTMAAEYFDTIQAPQKKLFWIENAGHMVDTDNPSAFFDAIREITTKL